MHGIAEDELDAALGAWQAAKAAAAAIVAMTAVAEPGIAVIELS
jgi:hypothetical protein